MILTEAINLCSSHLFYFIFLVAEGQENEGNNGNRANANENVDAGIQGNQWWGIVKEIQMIVFGFITSLLPGFHNID